MRKFVDLVDRFIRVQAEAASLLMMILVILMCYEVVMRYFFNAPTIWGLEFTTFLFGIHFVMGYAYTESFDGHVRVDIFSSRFSQRTQDIIHITLSLLITLPLVTLLGIWAWDNAITSTRIFEHLSSAWAPPIWPVKLFMALGFTLLLLQVLTNLIKRVLTFGHKHIPGEETP